LMLRELAISERPIRRRGTHSSQRVAERHPKAIEPRQRLVYCLSLQQRTAEARPCSGRCIRFAMIPASWSTWFSSCSLTNKMFAACAGARAVRPRRTPEDPFLRRAWGMALLYQGEGIPCLASSRGGGPGAGERSHRRIRAGGVPDHEWATGADRERSGIRSRSFRTRRHNGGYSGAESRRQPAKRNAPLTRLRARSLFSREGREAHFSPGTDPEATRVRRGSPVHLAWPARSSKNGKRSGASINGCAPRDYPAMLGYSCISGNCAPMPE